MALVPLPRERATYVDHGEALRVILPPRRSAFILILLAIWLAFWFVGAKSALHEITAPTPSPARAFLVIWLSAWVIGGCFAAFTFLWMLLGREIIEVRADQIVLRKELLGISRSRGYDITQVKDLRVGPVVPPLLDGSTFQRLFDAKRRWQYSVSQAAEVWGLAGGPIVFDYGPRTIRCGAALDEAEGKMVIERLRARNSRLRVAGAA